MRRTAIWTIVAALGAACLAAAQDPPASRPAEHRKPELKRKTIAFLGVVVSPAPPVLAQQLGLPEGVGLVVDAVPENGPAKDVIQQHDVLHKLDGQLLINPPQLMVLVRLRKPGETVDIELFRGGKAQSVKVKLGQTEVAPFAGMPGMPGLRLLEGMPLDARFWSSQVGPLQTDDVQRELLRMIEEMPRVEMPHTPGGTVIVPRILSTRPFRLEQGPFRLDAQEICISTTDKEHQITLTGKDGKWTLQAKDLQGKVMYDGPVVIDENCKIDPQKNKDIPEALVNKLNHANRMIVVGGRLRYIQVDPRHDEAAPPPGGMRHGDPSTAPARPEEPQRPAPEAPRPGAI